jgi:hypothetical protein
VARRKSPPAAEEPEFVVEDLNAVLIEIPVNEIGLMLAGNSYKEQRLLAENETTDNGDYRLWVNTPLGLVLVDKIYLQTSDLVAEEHPPEDEEKN